MTEQHIRAMLQGNMTNNIWGSQEEDISTQRHSELKIRHLVEQASCSGYNQS